MQESIYLRLLILVITLSLAFLTYKFPHEPHQNTPTVTLAFWEALKGPKITQGICDRAEDSNIGFCGFTTQLTL